MTNITVLVGTTKGAFLLDGGSQRMGWRVRGPFCDLWPINHMSGADGALWAAGGNEWHGAGAEVPQVIDPLTANN
ncbi:MAG: hypothetical protein AAGA06_12885 [Pseudomonadota bacterium]